MTVSSSVQVPFLSGASEMAGRMRRFDWTRTALGPPERWPQSLRSAVSILLPSKAQIALFWGPELITLYNDAYRPVFGAKHPRALGLPIREAWSELWGSGLRELFESVLTTGEAFWATDRPFAMERYGYREETFFDISYDPVRDETGQVGGVFCIVSETTARVVGERRLKTLRDLAAQTPEGLTSPEEACRTAARAMAENRHDLPFALTYLLSADGSTAELAGASGLAAGSPAAPERVDLAPPDPSGAVWPFRSVRATGRAAVVELSGRCDPLPGGVWPEPINTAVVLPIGKPGQERLAGFLVAAASPRRPLDDAYRGFFDLLANQIGTAVANARAYDEERRRAAALAELDRAKTVFFSNVSHEFRTPLTLMLGPLADRLAGDTLPPEDRRELTVVHRNGLRLLRLVNTLLEFSRIEAGRAEAVFEPTDLGSYTAELASVFRSAVERAGLRLVVDCEDRGEPVYVDREMWEKVVLNLLSNALKFTFSGEIEVRVWPSDRQVMLAVRDTGVGIPPDALPHVFDRFHRIRGARARSHEGTGIGLALVQELVKLHGGDITVASEPGRGTTFTILIPRGTAHLPPDRIGAARGSASTVGALPYIEESLGWLPDTVADAAAREPVATSTSGARVLLADDNADMRDYLRRLLSRHWTVEAVSDGEAALEAARARPPDVVLADVMMPKLDGFGLLQSLRGDDRTRGVPVILLSARAGAESRVEGLEAGADDYLVKPFAARELVARVEGLVRLKRLREEMQASVRESEQRLAGILRQASVGVAQTDLAGRFVFVNDRYCAIVGRARDELLRLTVEDITHPGDLPQNRELLQRTGETGEDFVIEKRYLRPDGSVVWVQNSVYAVRNADGAPEALVAICVDISDRRRALDALRESEERFRTMADNAPVIIWVSDASGGRTYVNRQWVALTGQSLESGLGDGWRQLVHPADRQHTTALFVAAEQTREPLRLEYRLRRADGEYRWAIDSAAARFGPAGDFLGYIGSVIDIHDRRQADELLRQSAKMEAIGRLAGGMAHDFNNQLHALSGFAAFVARDGGLSGQSRLDLLEIQKATERMASLTRQLLAFSRQQLLLPETLDLNDALRDSQALLQRLLGSDIQIVVRFCPEHVWVRVDRGQLLQVLMNLAINARDAMPDGGVLRLEIARREVKPGNLDALAGAPVEPGTYAELVVGDSGTGIAPEHLAHVFEPFFTTKEVGKGTGLGLATVHGIVTQSGGYVWPESPPGGGARFTVLLPLVGAPDATPPAQDVEPTPANRPARLLVVEDEEAVGAIIVRTLALEGYEVLHAREGRAALEQLERLEGAVDVVISDVVMPVMGGRELRKRIAKTWPELPVVWLSGYPQAPSPSGRVSPDDEPFLQKPVSPELLVEVVRRTLENRPAAAGRASGPPIASAQPD